MKYLSVFFLFNLIACTTSSITEQQMENRVRADIDEALAENDKRLYFMGGRIPNFPGINVEELDDLISKCGKRIVENTSDIIKQNDDIKNRELAFQYAKKYNDIMKFFCLKE